MTRNLRLWLFTVFSFWMCGSGLAGTVELSPGHGIPDLKEHLTYLSDPSASLADMLKRYRAGEFRPDLEAFLLDTNYAPEAWAAVDIVNATLDDGRPPDPFVLTIDLPLVSELDAYLIRDSGLTEKLVDYSIFEPFSPEDHSAARLRSQVFKIAPQEKVTLLVNFKFGPFQSFAMSLETPGEMEAAAFASGISQTAFYAFTLSCLVFFFGFHLAMKSWVGLLYTVQFGVGLTIIAYIDGLLFRFFFPDNPALQSPVGYFLLFALSGLGFLISGATAYSNKKGTGTVVLLSFPAVLSVLGFIASLYSPGSYAAFAGYILLAVMLLSIFISGGDWGPKDQSTHMPTFLFSVMGVAATLALIIALVVGSKAELIAPSVAVKSIYSIMLIATMTGISANIIALRRRHAKAVRAEMEALAAEAKRSQELLVAERNYTRARELASLRQRQLATASHDLKQPIMSLRMNFDSLAEHAAPEVRQRLKEAFDYMEALSNDYLKETTPDLDEDGQNDADLIDDTCTTAEKAEADAQEVYKVSLVLETVHQMFNEEAISKGLELRCVSSGKKIAVPPLILMRIVSNLVSNAVKYTERGSVLIGVRDRGQAVDLCVVDTGPGMDGNEIEAFAQAYNKGANSQGHGLGLSVCFELSKQNDLDLTCHSEKGKGTRFTLRIPKAA